MVHVRTRHPVSLWTGTQKPETNADRLIILGWKSNEKVGRKAHSARCISVPLFQPSLGSDGEKWSDILIDAVEKMQKEIAHEYVTECLNANGGVCNDIPADLITPDAVLKRFNEQEAGEDSSRGKITGEQIKGWFSETLQPFVVKKLAENAGLLADNVEFTEEQLKEIQQQANLYRSTLERLAAPVPKIDVQTAKTLKKAVELLPVEQRETDAVAKKLGKKLEAIINPPEHKIVSLASL